MRVALALNLNNIDWAIETYKCMAKGEFIFGSPTLYNAGSNHQQMSSCFLLKIDDNIESILGTITDAGLISKRAGGIGISISDIRASGSYIRGTNGNSSGVIPMIQVFNWLGRYINQGGRRNGAIALYIETWHADIFHFCELRSNKGKDEERARDIFLALWIPDLFMKRVQTNDVWSLMCPDECPGLTKTYGEEFEKLYIQYESEGRYKKQIRASELWFHILSSQIETGMPYMVYKDNVNRQTNQSNLGVIQSSNLCVSGDTYILTDKGQMIIKDMVNQKVNVWNGEEFSSTVVKKTGTNKKLISVKLSNGVEIKCTPEHKFYISGGAKNQKQILIQADQLKLNDRLIKYDLPTIKLDGAKDMKYAYTHGFYCGDGCEYANYSKIKKYPKGYLYGEKKKTIRIYDI
jgi:ribonucleoside-diphosphate reductase alpha chain